MTPVTLSIAKKVFTFFAVVKYLFFPYISAQAAGTDFNKMLNTNATITCKDVTEKAVWVGTTEGLYKISKKDGSIQLFTTENSQLPGNHVTGICTNSNDNVFVATNKGILRYDGYAFMTITTENAKLPTDNFTAIACDGADNLWLGTNNGLVMMRGNKTQVFTKQNSVMSNNQVVSMKTNGMISITVTLGDSRQMEITNQGMELIEVAAAMDIVARGN